MGGKTAEHELEVPRIDGHSQLCFRCKGNYVAGIFLGPAFQHGAIGGVRCEVFVLFKDAGLQFLEEFMIQAVLFADDVHEGRFHARPADFFGDDEIVFQPHVALRFFRIRTETKFFDFLHKETGNAEDINVEDGMLGYGAVSHLEDDVLVGLPRFFHLLPGDGTQCIDGLGAAADPGVSGGDRLRREILGFRPQFLNIPDCFKIDIVAGEDNFHKIGILTI